MSLIDFEQMKCSFREASKQEANKSIKESLLAMGGSIILGVGVYLYGSHMGNAGRHIGRMEMLDKLHKAACELESTNKDINKN